MENEQDKKDPESILKQIRFKSLPFEEKKAFKRLTDRLNQPVVISYARNNNNNIWKYLSFAASIALLFSISLYIFDRGPKEELVYYETTAVPDSKTKIMLPDSSVVWLNANASLRYPREFTEKTRQVSISGEAFFEVHKDAVKPFIVQTDGIRIQVLGTTFNVEAEAQSDKIEVTLLTGKIAIYTNANHSGQADRILSPGEQAVFTKADKAMAIYQNRTENATSWVTGEFRFKDNTLEEITRELQRAFHVKIHIGNESLRKQTFNADFTDKETLEEILSILQISARYKIEKEKGEIFLQ